MSSGVESATVRAQRAELGAQVFDEDAVVSPALRVRGVARVRGPQRSAPRTRGPRTGSLIWSVYASQRVETGLMIMAVKLKTWWTL